MDSVIAKLSGKEIVKVFEVAVLAGLAGLSIICLTDREIIITSNGVVVGKKVDSCECPV